MPTYDYRCRQCGRTYEVIHSMLAEGPTTCEHCGGQLRRVLHPAGIIFKGSGFYRTDSRSGSPAGDGRAPGVAEEKAKSEPESKGSAADAGKSSQTSTGTGAKGESATTKD